MSCSNCESIGKGTLDNHKMLQENMRLLNRVVELEAENARLKEQLKIEFDKREALDEELAAAQLDAARYRWLRTCTSEEVFDRLKTIYPFATRRFDEVIDSAMKGEQP